MKKLFLAKVRPVTTVFMVLSVVAMEVPNQEKSSKDKDQNYNTEQSLHEPKSLFEISKSAVCNLLTTVDPQKMDESIQLLKNLISRDMRYKDVVYSELIDKYKYQLFEIYKKLLHECPKNLSTEGCTHKIFKNAFLPTSVDTFIQFLDIESGNFIIKIISIDNENFIVLMNVVDKNYIPIAAQDDCLSIKLCLYNQTDLLITCKKGKKLLRVSELREIAKFTNIEQKKSIIYSLDGKFVLTKADDSTEVIWNYALPKLSLEELVLVLKLHNLKLAGKNLSELFNYPFFAEIFNNITNKDEILGSLVKDLELDCAICFDKLEKDRAKQKCGHDQFHFACIEQWKEMQNDSTCPICRQEI